VAAGEHEVDLRAPVFFLSYARATSPQVGRIRERNRFVMDLFDDLSADVGELLGRLPGADPGFMDRIMPGGERATEELLLAAATCQVFVPLISPSLVRSEWCAIEWDVFSRRTVTRRDGRHDLETAVLPVVWAPAHAADLPKVIRDVQMFSPTQLPKDDYAAQYFQDGLYGLRTMGLEDAYRAIVWRLARRIVDIHYSHVVAPLDPIPTGVEGLRKDFAMIEKEAS
jgi:hypothetical protein